MICKPTIHARDGLRSLLLSGAFLLLLLLYSGGGLWAQNCVYSGTQGSTVSGDSDNSAAGAFILSTTYDVFPPSFASNVTVVGDATVRICYYGDMEGATETWRTTIAGEGAFSCYQHDVACLPGLYHPAGSLSV